MRNAGQHSRTGSAPETQRGLSSFAFLNARPASLSQKSITLPVRSIEANAAYISGDTIPERPTAAQDTTPTVSWLMPDPIAGSEDTAELIAATKHPLAARAKRDIGPEAHSAESSTEIMRQVKGQLPGLTHAWDMVKVEQRKGKDVFVCILPQTGEKFGKKYYRDADGKLQPVYPRLGERLHMLRQQGLGGGGSKVAARVWSLLDAAQQARRGDRLDPQGAEPLRALEPPQAIHADEVAERAAHNPLPSPVELLELPDDSLSEHRHSVRTEGLSDCGAIHAARDMSLADHLDQTPPETVEEIFQHLDLSELLTFYQSDARYRDIAVSVMRKKWNKAQWQQKITDAVLADQSEVLNTIRSIKEGEGLIQLEGFDVKELLAKALDKNLSELTYRHFLNLLDFTEYTQPHWTGTRYTDIDILTAALNKNNVAAVRAIVANPRYSLSEVTFVRWHCDLQVERVVNDGNFDLIRAIYDSSIFNVNSEIRHFTPLQHALDSPACGPEIIEYFLSKPDLDVGPVLTSHARNLNLQKFAQIMHDPRADVNYLMQYPLGEQSTVLTSAIDRAIRGSSSDMEIFDLILSHRDIQVDKSVINGGTRENALSIANYFLSSPFAPNREDIKNRARIIINKLNARRLADFF